MSLKLYKSEKLCSLTAIDALFAAPRGKGALTYPVRAVWSQRPEGCRRTGAPVQFMISVPKKKLKHAVDRVTIRRRMREAYRLNRHLLQNTPAQGIDLALIYVASELIEYKRIERAICRLLEKLSASCSLPQSEDTNS